MITDVQKEMPKEVYILYSGEYKVLETLPPEMRAKFKYIRVNVEKDNDVVLKLVDFKPLENSTDTAMEDDPTREDGILNRAYALSADMSGATSSSTDGDAEKALERMRQNGSLLPHRLQQMHYHDYTVVKAALQSTRKPPLPDNIQTFDQFKMRMNLAVKEFLAKSRYKTVEDAQKAIVDYIISYVGIGDPTHVPVPADTIVDCGGDYCCTCCSGNCEHVLAHKKKKAVPVDTIAVPMEVVDEVRVALQDIMNRNAIQHWFNTDKQRKALASLEAVLEVQK